MRAVSTVVDATVFLLLVGGAIATLVAGTGTIPSDGENPAAESATLIATTTATVNYSLAPATEAPPDGVTFPRTNGSDFERSAHGTLASLLADAAVGNVGVDGEVFSRANGDFEDRVAAVVRDRMYRSDVRTSVVAVWRPYPDAPIRGRIQVGDDPPRDADVHAATVRAGRAIPAANRSVRLAGRDDGYRGVARALATTTVRGLFPPRETQLAIRGDYPVDTLTAQRYRRTADALGTHPPGVDEVGVTRANERLADALARRLEADLRERYESPNAAANAVRTDTVRIVVRTWSP